MTEPFDSGKLIELVKWRPGLWDPEIPADRDGRLRLWKEVGAAMYEDWLSCNKAEAYDRVLQLQRKWRSLRDAYNRELRGRRTGVRVNKRVYVYFKKMSFLGGFEEGSAGNNGSNEETAASQIDANNGNTNTTASSVASTDYHVKPESDPLLVVKTENHVETGELQTDPLLVVKAAKKKVKKTKRRKPSLQSEPIEELDMTFISDPEPEESEGDKQFLLSFLPEMKQLPVHIKMWARAQIANVMQEAVAAHCNNVMPSIESLLRLSIQGVTGGRVILKRHSVKRRKSHSDSNQVE